MVIPGGTATSLSVPAWPAGTSVRSDTSTSWPTRGCWVESVRLIRYFAAAAGARASATARPAARRMRFTILLRRRPASGSVELRRRDLRDQLLLVEERVRAVVVRRHGRRVRVAAARVDTEVI